MTDIEIADFINSTNDYATSTAELKRIVEELTAAKGKRVYKLTVVSEKLERLKSMVFRLESLASSINRMIRKNPDTLKNLNIKYSKHMGVGWPDQLSKLGSACHSFSGKQLLLRQCKYELQEINQHVDYIESSSFLSRFVTPYY